MPKTSGHRHKLPKGGSLWITENTFVYTGWPSTATGCLQRLWSFHPWRHSKATWMWFWETDSKWLCLSRGLNQMTFRGSFQPLSMKWTKCKRLKLEKNSLMWDNLVFTGRMRMKTSLMRSWIMVRSWIMYQICETCQRWSVCLESRGMNQWLNRNLGGNRKGRDNRGSFYSQTKTTQVISGIINVSSVWNSLLQSVYNSLQAITERGASGKLESCVIYVTQLSHGQISHAPCVEILTGLC